jgi:hypothetical protein
VVERLPSNDREVHSVARINGIGLAVGSHLICRPVARDHSRHRRLWASEHVWAAIGAPRIQ